MTEQCQRLCIRFNCLKGASAALAILHPDLITVADQTCQYVCQPVCLRLNLPEHISGDAGFHIRFPDSLELLSHVPLLLPVPSASFVFPSDVRFFRSTPAGPPV